MADTCAARPLDLPETQAQADTRTAALLASESGAETERARRVLPVARRAVEDYAPGAPAELKTEAVLRFGSYLLGSDFGTVQSETLGPRTVSYPLNHAAAFRNSGAAMLLSRYRVRRAGAIG